jgi:hypothetical protein
MFNHFRAVRSKFRGYLGCDTESRQFQYPCPQEPEGRWGQ